MLGSDSTPPLPLGKTSHNRPVPSSEARIRGQASRHSFSVLATIGAISTSRCDVSDFGLPITPQRSARWRTRTRLRSKSTSSQVSPRRLGGSEPGKERGYDNCAAPAFGGSQQLADFVFVRDVGMSTPISSFF